MFALDRQPVIFTNLNYRNEKHGAERVPAIDLSGKVDISSDKLNEIKPGLRETLYRQPRRGDQMRLADDNDASGFTELRHPDIEPICIKGEFPGYEMSIVVNQEEDDANPPMWEQLMFLSDVTVKGLKVHAHEGGTATVSFKLSDSSIDLDDDLPVMARAVNKERAVLLLTPPTRLAEEAANDEPEHCESGDEDCGPVEFHDSQGVPLCKRCYDALPTVDSEEALDDAA